MRPHSRLGAELGFQLQCLTPKSRCYGTNPPEDSLQPSFLDHVPEFLSQEVGGGVQSLPI